MKSLFRAPVDACLENFLALPHAVQELAVLIAEAHSAEVHAGTKRDLWAALEDHAPPRPREESAFAGAASPRPCRT